MKRILVIGCLVVFLGITALIARAESDTVSLNAITIAEDGTTITATISLPNGFSERHSTLYLFRVDANHKGDLTGMTPIATHATAGTSMTISLPYDATDPAAALYGYVLARVDENGGYLPLSKVTYPENFADYAPHNQAYPTISSKKGLQVQLITDAQLLGVKHTVVNAFFNELITDTPDDAVAFLYGGTTYYLNATALSALDYRIRSLTDAGIHIYLNYLLAYDASAPSSLYYPQIEENASTLYAPNVSTPDGIHRYAAVMHFLAARYTDPDGTHGFCGSYILGYEVNAEGDRHSMGMKRLSDFADQTAILLRIADTAVRSAYRNGRVFLSLSNQWDTASDDPAAYHFGSKDLLDEITLRCSDLPFGVSLNPYPSDLALTAYWQDEKATDDWETPYLTMKNISVLTAYLNKAPFLYQGQCRPIVLGEFGLSGQPGTSEDRQAAAYLMAYATVCQNPQIEALIWHRHVDHAGEKNLYYGLYASSHLLLEPTDPKVLHTVFSAVDTDHFPTDLKNRLLSLLPEGADPWAMIPADRTVFSVTATTNSPVRGTYDETLFNFSESLYHFYPTDNAFYLEQWKEEDATFLRTALIHISAGEYMGVGIPLGDMERINHARAITLRLRVTAGLDTADVRLLITGQKDGREIAFNGKTTVVCDQWVEVTFPLSQLSREALTSGILKLWTRFDSGASEELYLDIASITLHHEGKADFLNTILLLFGILALLCLLLVPLCVFLSRRRKHPRV